MIMAQHIIVVDYDPNWIESYEQESKRIRDILEDNCRDIYHIGSTSVPGLSAKPIIDIMPVVVDLELVDEHQKEFEALGYEYMGEFGMQGRRYLRKGGDERTHHIHIFDEHSEDINRHLALRDYLRAHEDKCLEYGELKKELALMYPYDNDGYCDAKEEYMIALEKEAIKWRAK